MIDLGLRQRSVEWELYFRAKWSEFESHVRDMVSHGQVYQKILGRGEGERVSNLKFLVAVGWDFDINFRITLLNLRRSNM